MAMEEVTPAQGDVLAGDTLHTSEMFLLIKVTHSYDIRDTFLAYT